MADNQSSPVPAFWRGALTGLLFSALGGIINGYVQNYFTMQQKGNQLFLDEKRDFVESCQQYLTQYRNWFSLMNYYAYRGTQSHAQLAEYDSLSIRPAYVQWHKEFDIAYGKVFLVANNEFGIQTLMVSDSLSKALTTLMVSNQLTPAEKQLLFQQTNEYFFDQWLKRAQLEIFRYNTGERVQKSVAEYVAEQQQQAVKRFDSIRVDDQLYDSWRKIIAPQLKQDSVAGRPHSLPSREEFGEMMHPQ